MVDYKFLYNVAAHALSQIAKHNNQLLADGVDNRETREIERYIQFAENFCDQMLVAYDSLSSDKYAKLDDGNSEMLGWQKQAILTSVNMLLNTSIVEIDGDFAFINFSSNGVIMSDEEEKKENSKNRQ